MLLRGSTDKFTSRQLVRRARSIFYSMTNDSIFRYCDTVNELDMTDIVYGFIDNLISIEVFYGRVLQFKVPGQITVRALSNSNFSSISDTVSVWFCQQSDKLPLLRQLGAKKLGFGIVVHAAFASLTSVKISSSVVSKTVGEAIVKGCPSLESIIISFPFTSAKLAFRSRTEAGLTPVELQDADKLLRDFLNAIPENSLKSFAACLHRTDYMHKEYTEDDPVGLDYVQGRVLLQALKRQGKLEKLKLVRLDPQAYIDLPKLDSLPDSLTELHLVLPDKIWGGNPGSKTVPARFLVAPFVEWLKNCRKLRKLYWSSRDDKQLPRFGLGTGWTELMATALPGTDAADKDLFPVLEDADLYLGLERTFVYTRIPNLPNLKHLRLVTDPALCPIAPRLRCRLNRDSEILAASLIKCRALETADIRDFNFYLKRSAFSFARKGGKVIVNTEWQNRNLRKLTLLTADRAQEVGMWKFLSYLPGLNRLNLLAGNVWNPQDLIKYIKGTHLTRKKNGVQRTVIIGILDRAPWEKMHRADRVLVEQHMDLKLFFTTPHTQAITPAGVMALAAKI